MQDHFHNPKPMNRILSLPLRLALGLLAMLATFPAAAEFSLPGDKIKKGADGVLTLMSFSVIPDLTSSFLSIGSGEFRNTSLLMTQFAGGDILSKDLPLYLEGSAGYIRFDPTFVASEGQDTQRIPVRWNSFALSGGVGWDFFVTPDLKIRPIANFALGQVASDLSLLSRYLEFRTDRSFDFLDNGTLNAYGLGGSLMVDYELVRPEYEIDVEWRYTNIRLQSFGGTSGGVEGASSAEATNLYTRYRAPTGLTLMQRPLRYVLEAAHTIYLGDQRELLGINQLSSLGVGLEVDSSAYDIVVTRTRLVARWAFGEDVHGFAVGLAMSF